MDSVNSIAQNERRGTFSTSILNVAAGKGMADYSNRGFFTVGTNFQDNSYELPSNNLADYTIVDATGDWGRPISLLTGTVTDLVFSTESNVKLSALSAWDQSMTEAGGPRVYAMYPENYDDQARLLIPRAVAYSSGLLNYFFRGTIKIRLPAEQVYAVADFSTNAGFGTIKVSVKNATPAIDGADQMTASSGKLIAVLRYRRNICADFFPTLGAAPHLENDQLVWNEACRSPSLDGQPLPDILVSNPAAVPATFDQQFSDVAFTFPNPLPFDAIDVDLQIVYRGQLGTESDGIAVGFEHITEPNFFDFENNNDCAALCSDPNNPSCQLSGSVKLPFWNAPDAPGWRQVASVSALKPGQYARVAFLTRSAFSQPLPDGSTQEVTTNQNFPYSVTVTYRDGTTAVWNPGVVTRSPLVKSRNLTGGKALYSWSHLYGVPVIADNCPLIDPTPRGVAVNFP